MKRIDQIVAVALTLWAGACLVLIVWRSVHNPMTDRHQALDQRMERIAHAEQDLAAPQAPVYNAVHVKVAQKMPLWRELIAPPPPPTKPPKPEPKPDLMKRLQGVVASLREEIVVGEDARVVKIRTPQNPSGRWMSIGDKVNGLTILEIGPEAVVFTMNQQGKDYTVDLPRT